jgi:acyl-CoA reductase-like NAD-dependent aldehyde dehydrogenase
MTRTPQNDGIDMSDVQFAPAVSDDIRLAEKMLIGGEWVGAISGRTLPVYDPADGRLIVEVPDGDAADVDRAVAGAAAGAFATQASIKLGRGTDPATQMGPLISAEHRDKVFGYPAIGIAEGAEVVTGGHAVAGEGYFAEPAVWTRDISRAHRMAAAIESGQVWVNCYQAADSALPFGGTKESGWGRETCRETLEECLETKTVVVSL